MIVSHAKKFIFIHNPKCAGTTFREAIGVYHDEPVEFWGVHPSDFFLEYLDFAHLRLWEMAAHFPEIADKFVSYRSIVFVRDPYRRFVSAVHEHFRQYRPAVGFEFLQPHRRIEITEDFVAGELTAKKILCDYQYVHFSPQSWFINLGGRRMVRSIIPLGSGNAHIETVRGMLQLPVAEQEPANVSAPDSNCLLNSPHVMRFIEDFYRIDMVFFSQYEALAGLARPPRVFA